MQWDQALNLAAKLAPEEVASISLQYAQQLEANGAFFFGEYLLNEVVGDHRESLNMFNRAWTSSEATIKETRMTTVDEKWTKMQRAIKAGLARETLRMGDIPKGMRLLQDASDRAVIHQCAQILENLKQLLEAAVLYEKSDAFEKAAELYIKSKTLRECSQSDFCSQKLHQSGRTDEQGELYQTSNSIRKGEGG